MHRSCPLHAGELDLLRVTSVVSPEESAEIIQDEWGAPAEWTRTSKWKGYSFFKTLGESEKKVLQAPSDEEDLEAAAAEFDLVN